MALKTKIKVDSITSLSEARFCAGMGVDFLGFSIDVLERDLKNFREITSWVTGPLFILQCENHSLAKDKLLSSYHDHWQFRIQDINELDFSQFTKPVFILVDEDINADLLEKLKQHREQIDYLIITVPIFDSHRYLLNDFKVLLKEPDADENFDNLLKLNVDGFAIEGTKEVMPGILDYEHLSRLFDQLEVSED